MALSLQMIGETNDAIRRLVSCCDVPDRRDMLAILGLNFVAFLDFSLVESRLGQVVLWIIWMLPYVTGTGRVCYVGLGKEYANASRSGEYSYWSFGSELTSELHEAASCQPSMVISS